MKVDGVLRWGLAFIVTGLVSGLALVAIFWGREVWGEPALAWPGGPYGMASTTGFLVPCAIVALVVTLTRVKWREDKASSLKWIAASLPGQVLASVIVVVLFSAMLPKKRNRDAECYSEGGACWLRDHYPYLWAVLWGSALVTGAVVVGARVVYRRRRTVASTVEVNASGRPVT